MGGYSKESSISLKSGNTVYKNLCNKQFHSYCVYIFKDEWFMKDENNTKYPINKKDFSVNMENKSLKFDCIFNAIHGTPGEDGMLQAYFDLLNIPYTGCNFYQSNITFNKKYCLNILRHFGINTAKSVFLNKNQKINKKIILDKIGFPCFVKPNKSGSSLGVSKVFVEKNLNNAMDEAFKEDEEIIIQSFLKGKEVSVGVLKFKNEILVLPITEIISQNEFFDFESKYSGKSKEITPSKLAYHLENKIKYIAKKVYRIFNLSGITRSEYIIVNGKPYFLEINTIPGLSEDSIVPKQFKIAGISLSDVFCDEINRSIEQKT